MVWALRDGTFARNFNAVRGRSPALRGARVAEDRSREENGDDPAATTKKSGGGGSAPLLLIILAVVGAYILCAAAGACVYARWASKDKVRATAAYSAQWQRTAPSGSGRARRAAPSASAFRGVFQETKKRPRRT